VQKPSRWYCKRSFFQISNISLIDPKRKQLELELELKKEIRFSKNLIKYYSNGYIPRLKEEYKNRVISALKEYGYTNVSKFQNWKNRFEPWSWSSSF
jgi:hypothetical protein